MRPAPIPRLTRRQFVARAILTVGATGSVPGIIGSMARSAPADGRLGARPVGSPTDPLAPGVHVLSVAGTRQTVVVVPPGVPADRPSPLILMLHGATGDSVESLDAMRDVAGKAGIILLAPSSAGTTWDAIRGGYGDDFNDIDAQLQRVFQHCAVDTTRIGIAGFSDGASYGVSLGLINGDLFTHVIAHSAGFIIPGTRHGHPRVFMAHGSHDRILPIDQCGRRIASDLHDAGYDVEFAPFDGGHMIRPEMVQRSLDWFMA
jgi:predicted esterase